MDHGRSPFGDDLLQRLDALEHRTQQLATLVGKQDVLLAEKDALIAVQQEQLAAQQAALDQACEQLTLLKKALFAPRRERYVPGPDQQLLFEALPLETQTTEDALATAPEPLPKPRRKSRRK